MSNTIVINTPGGPVQVESAGITNGENVLVVNTPAGPVEYTSGTISPGDNLLVATTPAGLVAVTDGAPGSKTGGGGGSVGPGLTYNGQQVTCIKITDGFVKPAIPFGVSTDLGELTFGWDGTGHIFIASNCKANPDTDLIWTDDKITVTNTITGEKVEQVDAPYPGTASPHGTSSEGCANSLDLEITNILEAGDNTIDTVISDVYGNLTGCCALYIIQVADSSTPTPPPPGMGYVDTR